MGPIGQILNVPRKVFLMADPVWSSRFRARPDFVATIELQYCVVLELNIRIDGIKVAVHIARL